MFAALAFVLFCGLCTVNAFRRHPVWGLYFYLTTFYVHPPSRWWGYMLPDLRWSLSSAAVAVLAVAIHRGRLQSKPPWIANAPAVILSIYAAWMWFQCAWALDLETHLDGAVKFVKYLIAFWLVYRVVDTKEMLRNFLFAHVAGCTLLGLLAQFVGRDGGRLDGVGGPGLDDANTLGMYLATGAIAGLGLFLSEKGCKRWGILAMMAVIVNGFVLANSRGAFLGLLGGSLTLMFCKARAHRKQFWALVMAGLVGFAAIVDTVFIERMFTIGDVVEESDDADMSARSRMEIYKAQLRMAADYPLGAGYRGTATLSPFYLDRKWLARNNGIDDPDAARTSHNTLMSTLVEQGLPGFVLFLVLIGWLLLAALRVRRMNRGGVDPALITLSGATCATLVVVMVAGTATDYLMAEVQFWMFAALVSALRLGSTADTVRPPIGAPTLRPVPRPQS